MKNIYKINIMKKILKKLFNNNNNNKNNKNNNNKINKNNKINRTMQKILLILLIKKNKQKIMILYQQKNYNKYRNKQKNFII